MQLRRRGGGVLITQSTPRPSDLPRALSLAVSGSAVGSASRRDCVVIALRLFCFPSHSSPSCPPPRDAAKVSGTVDQSTGMLSQDVQEKGYALLCCAFPKSDLKINVIADDELLNDQLCA